MKALEKYPFAEGLVKTFGYSSYNIETGIEARYRRAKVVRPGKYIGAKGEERKWCGVKDDEDALKWLAQGGWLGAVIGKGFVVVDMDDEYQGSVVLGMLREMQLKFTAIKTPHGYQFIFRDTGRVKKQATLQQTRLGVRADYRLAGLGYIILPTKGLEPERAFIGNVEAEPSGMPQWLLPMQKEDEGNRVMLPVEQGKAKRHEALLSQCGRLKVFGAEKAEACEALKLMNTHFFVPPKSVEEVERIVEWCYDEAREEKITNDELGITNEKNKSQARKARTITPSAMSVGSAMTESAFLPASSGDTERSTLSSAVWAAGTSVMERVKPKLEIELVLTSELPVVEEDWLCEKFFARGRLTEIFGEPGAGKSLFVQSMFQHQADNHLQVPMQAGLNCLYILGKDIDGADIQPRYHALGGKYSLLHNNLEHGDLPVDFTRERDAEAFIEALAGKGLDAIVFDTKRKFYSGDEASSEVAAGVMTGFRRIAKALNVSVILLSHVVKSHTSITISSLPGNARWGGDLDIAWYIQGGENGVYLLTNVKRRNFGEVKPIKCKCVYQSHQSASVKDSASEGRQEARGFELTEEEYIVKAAESNRTMIASANGAGRPRAVEMEQAYEVLDMMSVEFWSWQFRNTATERFEVSKATAYRLMDELVNEKRIGMMREPENGKAIRYIKLSSLSVDSAGSASRATDEFTDGTDDENEQQKSRDRRDNIPF